jgi:hypothetical protein
MTDAKSEPESDLAAAPCSARPAFESAGQLASEATGTSGRQAGRHRAAENHVEDPGKFTMPDTAGPDAMTTAECWPEQSDAAVARALVAAKDPTRRSAVATLLVSGVGASAFYAAIEAARNAALRAELAAPESPAEPEPSRRRHKRP